MSTITAEDRRVAELEYEAQKLRAPSDIDPQAWAILRSGRFGPDFITKADKFDALTPDKRVKTLVIGRNYIDLDNVRAVFLRTDIDACAIDGDANRMAIMVSLETESTSMISHGYGCDIYVGGSKVEKVHYSVYRESKDEPKSIRGAVEWSLRDAEVAGKIARYACAPHVAMRYNRNSDLSEEQINAMHTAVMEMSETLRRCGLTASNVLNVVRGR